MRFRPQIFTNFVDHVFGIFLNNTGCVIFDILVILSLISLISCLKKYLLHLVASIMTFIIVFRYNGPIIIP